MPKLRKVGGAWRKVAERYRKVAGQWRPVKESYKKVDGVWRLVYQSLPSHITTFFENATTGASNVEWHSDGGFLRIYMNGASNGTDAVKCGIRITNIPANTRVILNMGGQATNYSAHVSYHAEYNGRVQLTSNSLDLREYFFAGVTTDFLLYVMFDRLAPAATEAYLDVHGLRFENDIIF